MNYRGVHLTAQLSKVVERLFLLMVTPFITTRGLSGLNQFAYTKKRGARDVLALLALKWVAILDKGRKVAIYCSDVAGAFDRVSSKRLLDKLEAKGWVKRQRSREDRRRHQIDLTPQGKTLLKQLWPKILQHEAEVCQRLSSQEIPTSLRLLEKIY